MTQGRSLTAGPELRLCREPSLASWPLTSDRRSRWPGWLPTGSRVQGWEAATELAWEGPGPGVGWAGSHGLGGKAGSECGDFPGEGCCGETPGQTLWWDR